MVELRTSSAVSVEALTEIFQSMSEGLIIVDEEGKVIISNHVAEHIFGYEKNGLVGLKMEELLPERHRHNHVNLRKGFNAAPSPRRMGMGRDLMALRKDGVEFPVEVSLSYTRYNKKLLVMAFISDISQRKKAQEDLKRSEEQLILYASELEKKVQMRTEALNNLVGELEKEVQERKRAVEETKKALAKERDLNDLKSKFVSLASHEFRTPLSTIMSSASLINQYKERGELEKVDKHVTRIKSSVGHLTNILNDFLSLGKLEEGKVVVQPENITLDIFLQEIEEELRATLKEGQRIMLDCNQEVKSIYSDGRILRNVLFNLISNASKYSPANSSIYLRCTSNTDTISFAITDQGIGIPEQDSKHMFERFYRASNAGNVQGTGLGLNIVKRYADLLDGHVSFTSELGKGSTFSITIPIQTP
jgi:PAS domain S-box-containing protein